MSIVYAEIVELNDALFDRVAFIESECFKEDEAFEREDIPAIIEESPIRFGAYDDGVLVAYSLARYAFGIGYLYSNAVLSQYRRQHIGENLANWRMTALLGAGICTFQAHTRLDNQASANLLMKLGFRPIQYVTDFYDDNIDAILWSKE
jgi:ribosomal protein S18 acetylase RimI-like enzyme